MSLKRYIFAIVAIFALSGVVAFRASAASGDECVVADPTHYNAVATTDKCWMICDGISQGVPSTSCGPLTKLKDQHGVTDFIVSIEKAQTNCITSTDFAIQESNSSVAGVPNVWTTVATLTGVLDPLISSYAFGRAPKGAVRVTYTALADTDCTDVDITGTAKFTQKMR